MKLKVDDRVKLLPQWAIGKATIAPYWGGPKGYVLGTVKKTLTGAHDRRAHVADVTWDDKTESSLPEEALEVATDDEKDISADATMSIGPIDRDIWCLIRTSIGGFGLSVIESMPFGTKERSAKYVTGVSRLTTDVVQSDYSIVATLLGQSDYREYRSTCLFDAANFIFEEWGLPDMGHLPLPLPDYATIHAAAKSCPATFIAASLFFHLPRNLIDYSDYPIGAVS